MKAMSSTQLELLRQNHEQIERYELAIGDELDVKPSGVSQTMNNYFITVIPNS